MTSASIIIVSGGIGYSAEQLVKTALAQFPDADAPVLRVPQVRCSAQVAAAVDQAAQSGALIAYTLVDAQRRRELVHMAHERGVPAVDLLGPLLGRIATKLGHRPLGQVGRFDEQNRSQLDRIAAIEYTLAHDDGAHPEDWGRAQILLVGVSRVGKTPLSMYLAVLGWKVANLPLVSGLDPPPELFALDRRRVVGLTIGLEQLIEHRRWREHRLGIPLGGDYSSAESLSEELERTDRLFRRCGFPVVDVTNKPLESIANEVTALIERHLSMPAVAHAGQRGGL